MRFPLGSSQRLDPRDCWTNEVKDLTLWLATAAGLQFREDAIAPFESTLLGVPRNIDRMYEVLQVEVRDLAG
jgi:hypothetical protein